MNLHTIADSDLVTIINFGQTLDEMIAAGNYDFTDGDLTPEYFPVRGTGIKKFRNKLFPFENRKEFERAKRAMKKKRFDPANHVQGLAFGAMFPLEHLRHYNIACLGPSYCGHFHQQHLALECNVDTRGFRVHDSGSETYLCSGHLLGVQEVSSESLQALVVRDEIAKGLRLPRKAHLGDVCFDIAAAEETVIPPFSGADVRTGIKIVPPPGYYFRVVGKGSSARRGLFFTLEIIDTVYRGEIILHPWNASAVEVKVERGVCIAQLELVQVTSVELNLVDISRLDKTSRGEGRMNSTRTGLD